jgi:hypothetical protein
MADSRWPDLRGSDADYKPYTLNYMLLAICHSLYAIRYYSFSCYKPSAIRHRLS